MKALIAGGVAAATFLSYCVYFDYQRRSDPMYKKKLREKRRAERNKARENELDIPMPAAMDQMSLQKFFMEQVQLGEDKLACKWTFRHFVDI